MSVGSPCVSPVSSATLFHMGDPQLETVPGLSRLWWLHTKVSPSYKLLLETAPCPLGGGEGKPQLPVGGVPPQLGTLTPGWGGTLQNGSQRSAPGRWRGQGAAEDPLPTVTSCPLGERKAPGETFPGSQEQQAEPRWLFRCSLTRTCPSRATGALPRVNSHPQRWAQVGSKLSADCHGKSQCSVRPSLLASNLSLGLQKRAACGCFISYVPTRAPPRCLMGAL